MQRERRRALSSESLPLAGVLLRMRRRGRMLWAGLGCVAQLAGCLPYGHQGPVAPADPPPPRYRVEHESEPAAPSPPPTLDDQPGPDAAGLPASRTEALLREAAPTPATPPVGASAAPSTALPPSADARWWTAFGDAELTVLVDRALAENLDLRVLFARVEQARALALQAAAPRWPTVSAQGDVSLSRAFSPFAGGVIDQTRLTASLPVSYEVDWLAKNAGRAEAQQLDERAARADVEAAAVTLAAQVAEAWFSLLEARARALLLAEQLRLNEQFLELNMLRFQQGLGGALDVHQQRQQVAATRAQRALAHAGIRVAQNQLSILLGRPPEPLLDGAERVALPPLPPLPPLGVPGDLLTQRPDVRAAARRVQAADERVLVAVAERLPSLLISGSPGYSFTKFSTDAPSTPMPGPRPLSGSFHGAAHTLGAVLNIPLFDGFQRRAGVDLNRARVHEAVENHSRVLLQAMAEVDNALSQARSQAENLAALEEQLAAARNALEAARQRYRQGLNDFLPVLTALQGVQQTELAILAARRQQLSYRVALHRALGGAWARELAPPPPKERTK